MRIRTANGIGFVRLVVALVVVLVLVMSGNAAFGQQSSKEVKSKRAATGQNTAMPQSSKKGMVIPVLQVPKEADVKNTTEPVYVDAERPSNPPGYVTIGGAPGDGSGNSGGSNPNTGDTQAPAPDGGSVPSDPPIVEQPGFCICKWTVTHGSVNFPPCPNNATEVINHVLNYVAVMTSPINAFKPLAVICFNGEIRSWSLIHEVTVNDGCGQVSVNYYTLYGSTESTLPRRCAGL